MSQKKIKLEAKVVLLGGCSIGKTSMVKSYIYDKFTPSCQATIEAAYF